MLPHLFTPQGPQLDAHRPLGRLVAQRSSHLEPLLFDRFRPEPHLTCPTLPIASLEHERAPPHDLIAAIDDCCQLTALTSCTHWRTLVDGACQGETLIQPLARRRPARRGSSEVGRPDLIHSLAPSLTGSISVSVSGSGSGLGLVSSQPLPPKSVSWT